MLWLNDLKNFGVHAVFGFNAQKRKELRKAIAHELSPTADELVEIRDLSRPPRLKKFSVSISHTKDFGGFIYARRPTKVGWDVEAAGRVRAAVIRRVSGEAELKLAPDPGLLWVAKEALFKALEDTQPKTLGDLRIGQWTLQENGLYQFCGHGGEGIARHEGAHLFAAVRIVSN